MKEIVGGQPEEEKKKNFFLRAWAALSGKVMTKSRNRHSVATEANVKAQVTAEPTDPVKAFIERVESYKKHPPYGLFQRMSLGINYVEGGIEGLHSDKLDAKTSGRLLRDDLGSDERYYAYHVALGNIDVDHALKKLNLSNADQVSHDVEGAPDGIIAERLVDAPVLTNEIINPTPVDMMEQPKKDLQVMSPDPEAVPEIVVPSETSLPVAPGEVADRVELEPKTGPIDDAVTDDPAPVSEEDRVTAKIRDAIAARKDSGDVCGSCPTGSCNSCAESFDKAVMMPTVGPDVPVFKTARQKEGVPAPSGLA